MIIHSDNVLKLRLSIFGISILALEIEHKTAIFPGTGIQWNGLSWVADTAECPFSAGIDQQSIIYNLQAGN